MTDGYYDGVRIAANRTNEASGRSWHIPAKPSGRHGFYAVVAVQLVAVSSVVGLFWAVLS